MLESLATKTADGRDVCLRIGVDMGGNDLKFGATDLAAEQLLLPDLVKRSSLVAEGPAKTVAQILDGLNEVLTTLSAEWAQIADIAVTVPCPCTRDGLIIEATNLGTADTKEKWKLPFGELLERAIEETGGVAIPVFACNDANAAAQDDDFERFGLDTNPATSRRTSVFITTGTGLGGCVMSDGSVFYGVGQAGELGHIKPAIPSQYRARFEASPAPTCGCGASDCVESRASLKGLMQRITWAVSDRGAAFIMQDLEARGEKFDVDVLSKLRAFHDQSPQTAAYNVRNFADGQQDPFCRWLLEDWAIMIGLLFANLSPALHPNLFVIGGGMTEVSQTCQDWFISVVRRVYSEVNGQSCFDIEAGKDGELGNCEIVWSVSKDQGWRGAILMGIRAEQSG